MRYLIIFLVMLLGVQSFGIITFQRTYGGSKDDYGNEVLQTPDGGYIIGGTTLSFGAGEEDIYLMKTDSLGDTLWTRTYGGTADDYIGSIQPTMDSGYIIVGTIFSGGSGDVYLITTDCSGDTLWTRTYGGTDCDWGESVQQTSDNGYIILVSTSSYGLGYNDIYLIKTDSLGDTLWTKLYGGNSAEYGRNIQKTIDGGYIIAGQTGSYGAGNWDAWLIKTDSCGDTIWTRTFGGTKEDYAYFVQQTSDSGYVAVGLTYSYGPGTPDSANIYLIKTDASGDSIWTRVFGGTNQDGSISARQTTDGGYIITGGTFSFGADSGKMWLIKTNSSGDTLWTRMYGDKGWSYGASGQQTKDGGFIISGITWGTLTYDSSNAEIYLIKTDENGNVGIEENARSNVQDARLEILKNPFIKSTSIRYSIPVKSRVSLKVYDLSGRLAKVLVNEEKPVGSYTVNLYGKGLATGVYFIKFNAGNYKETKKLILMK